MKKWTGIFLTLAILILVSYYIMGRIVESTLNKNIKALPKTPMLTLKLNKYDRGWFSSQAALTLIMHLPEQRSANSSGQAQLTPPLDMDLSFPLIINHGPIIMTEAGIRFGMGHVTTQPETHYNVLVDYSNHTRMRYTFPSLEINTRMGPENLHFEFKGITATLGLSPTVDSVVGKIAVHGLNGLVKNVVFNMSEIVNNFNVSRREGWLWIGRNHLTIPSIEFSEGNHQFVLEALDFSLATDITNDLLNADYNMSLQKLTVENKTWGPGVIKLQVKNLDPAAMARVNQASWNLVQNTAHRELFAITLISEYSNLMSKGAELNLSELNLTFPEGKITGNLTLSLPKGDAGGNPEKMMQKAVGNGQFRASIAVIKSLMVEAIQRNLERQQAQIVAQEPNAASVAQVSVDPVNTHDQAVAQTDQILQEYINKGILKIDGSDYVMIIKLENQQLMINGQVVGP